MPLNDSPPLAHRYALFEEPHWQSLELLAAQSLQQGDAPSAFAFADRRCRIEPLPGAHAYTLRAEALDRLGKREAALKDVKQALHLAPDDKAANQRLLSWGDRRERIAAAETLIGGPDRDPALLRTAITTLQQNGRSNVANVTAYAEWVFGWAIWQGDAELEITLTDGAATIYALREADAFHPLSGFGRAADFDLRLRMSRDTQTLRLSVAGEVFYEKRLSPTIWTRSHGRPRATPYAVDEAARYRHVTIIIPVYKNLEVTRVCPQSVLASRQDNDNIDILIVNDAAPERELVQYLRRCAKNTRVQLLENQQNLGFVGSVNCALSVIDDGDVVLLNSDTVVPPDFVKRLGAASGPDIGTVTPLSNNGEYVSFPRPNQSNPLESAEALLAIDATAARVNEGRVVEIPSGIGFCLYITRDCLDAVGLLSEDFHRGYLEDVDFCLRARERGYKSVCAGSVYVGHVGAVSFGTTKRTLVAQNDKILRARHPKHWREVSGVRLGGSLRDIRANLERGLSLPERKHRILVSGSAMSMAIAERRAQLLRDGGQDVLILDISCRNGSREARIINPRGASHNPYPFASQTKMAMTP